MGGTVGSPQSVQGRGGMGGTVGSLPVTKLILDHSYLKSIIYYYNIQREASVSND